VNAAGSLRRSRKAESQQRVCVQSQRRAWRPGSRSDAGLADPRGVCDRASRVCVRDDLLSAMRDRCVWETGSPSPISRSLQQQRHTERARPLKDTARTFPADSALHTTLRVKQTVYTSILQYRTYAFCVCITKHSIFSMNTGYPVD